MKFKRCMVLLVSILLLITAVPFVSAAPAVTLTVGTVSARPGDTVTVPLSISQVSGLGAIGVHLYYDTAVLECVSATAQGIILQMDTNTANTTPVNHPGEVWLTGMCLAGVSGSGTIMNVTFKVKNSAPNGLSAIGFTDTKQEVIDVATATYMSESLVSGGVTVSSSATPQRTTTTKAGTPVTTVPTAAGDTSAAPDNAATTVPGATQSKEAPAATGTQSGETTQTANEGSAGGQAAGSNESEAVITRNNGETVTVPAMTMVDEHGTVVTDAAGEPVKVPGIAVMIDEVTALPGEQVTVKMETSAFSNIATLGVDVSYDTEALTFVSGTIEGALKEQVNSPNIHDNGEGVVVLSAMDAEGISGSGTIATLTFEVNKSAKNGKYRLALTPQPLFVTKDGHELSSMTYAGLITVEGAGGTNTTLWIVIGIVAAVAVATTVVLAVKAKQKKTVAQPEGEQQ